MGLWGPQTLGSNLSVMALTDDAQDTAIISHQRGTTTPPYPQVGQFWVRTDYSGIGEAVMYYTASSSWTLFADPDFAQLNAGGTVAPVANLPMGGFKLTNLAAGSSAGDSVRYEQVCLLSGSTWTGNHNAGGNKLTNLGAPTSGSDAARLDDAQRDADGQFAFIENVVIQTDASPTTTYNDVGFVPREVTLRLYGNVTDQADADLHGTMDEELTFRRWEGDGGAGFGGTTGKTLVKSVTVGSKTIHVYVEPKYTTPYGFWFSAERSDSGERVNIAMVQAFCHYGIGQ